ncbi:MAG: mannose-6-phosphate isomerase [Candidatus Paceibacteria bacterium]|jgi:mannose-6-phosphate isomerase
MSTQDPQSSLRTSLGIPLRFERICLEKVWGGRALEEVPGIHLEAEGPVGETWELVDRTDNNSVVRDGPFAGRELRDLMATDRESLLGESALNGEGRFPVLIKYLSASQPLSIQVHPDDRTARNLGAGDCGKTESWFILSAEPGSLVYLGLRDGVDPADFANAARGAGIVDMLQPWPVKPGQFVHVPAGTLHAIGAGVTLVEVQQNSDLTYRLFDWGRCGLDGNPRKIHAREGLLSIRYDQLTEGPQDPELTGDGDGGDNRSAHLVQTDCYDLEIHEVGSHLEVSMAGHAHALILVEGNARLWVDGEDEPWTFDPGDTWLVPAAVGTYRIENCEGAAKILVVRIRG